MQLSIFALFTIMIGLACAIPVNELATVVDESPSTTSKSNIGPLSANLYFGQSAV
ncbi:hypothetical protein HYPSUDRAFT_44662 [Hypholoma sublateritium FD-334 SS-4]|uniref:Uncharacterized protein n=1 Tax=Hypholoma sublateritium (strain FD-334 SS-4) TaxID=945553 RepID=A0A0D2M6Y3_HYPSF|nr:hypothetical protein HYPSUDRAFT_44662 [Hypholoma sublateritium FD-334 SS-4]